ncbi:hypothetical protein SKAU_G00310980 [Synaphobranchus kaupii]|uniref:Uncharacterized protein n=1 Tax=Synaphobranchus kaupii TaxID=118154 RepID=A0A9Q1ERV1_SYNKA|nr:hypothetical protein SKAU_G00310980 [Synaphobranchus kaupii]
MSPTAFLRGEQKSGWTWCHLIASPSLVMLGQVSSSITHMNCSPSPVTLEALGQHQANQISHEARGVQVIEEDFTSTCAGEFGGVEQRAEALDQEVTARQEQTTHSSRVSSQQIKLPPRLHCAASPIWPVDSSTHSTTPPNLISTSAEQGDKNYRNYYFLSQTGGKNL